ncbi:hypothetical protein OSTOST_19878, partial [Ostertagia ostertagi]
MEHVCVVAKRGYVLIAKKGVDSNERHTQYETPPPQRSDPVVTDQTTDSMTALLLQHRQEERTMSGGTAATGGLLAASSTDGSPIPPSLVENAEKPYPQFKAPPKGSALRYINYFIQAIAIINPLLLFKALGRMILQRTGVPITHYEPLTALQLLCEEMRYSKLLDRACTKTTAEERMVYVAAFAVSPYPNSTGRFRKFFNPLLGETYEYEQEDFKYHGE